MKLPSLTKGFQLKRGLCCFCWSFVGASFRSVEHKETRARRRTLYSVLVGLWHVAIVSSFFFNPYSPFGDFCSPPKTNGWRAFLSAGCGFFYINGRWWFRFLFFHAKNYRRFRLGQGWNLLSCSVDIGCHFSSHE